MNGASRLARAIAAIDSVNSEDPRPDLHDPRQPWELAYSRRMSERLESFEPGASDALRIAARAQHIARWKIPRQEYPLDRGGYKHWRTDLGKFHAETAEPILREAGYGDDAVERVKSLLRKRELKTDPECQTLEDVICLVFLEYYAADFAEGHGEDELIRILRRTWAKMSQRGRKAALGLPLDIPVRTLIGKALAD